MKYAIRYDNDRFLSEGPIDDLRVSTWLSKEAAEVVAQCWLDYGHENVEVVVVS